MTHNWIDVVVLFILVLMTALGAWSGMIRSLFRLLAWAGGLAGSWFLGDTVALWLQTNIAALPHFAARFAGSVLAFVLPFVVLILIGSLLHRAVKKSPLGGANRAGGAALGLLKGLILSLLCLFLLGLVPAKGELKAERESSQAYKAYLWVFHHIPLRP